MYTKSFNNLIYLSISVLILSTAYSMENNVVTIGKFKSIVEQFINNPNKDTLANVINSYGFVVGVSKQAKDKILNKSQASIDDLRQTYQEMLTQEVESQLALKDEEVMQRVAEIQFEHENQLKHQKMDLENKASKEFSKIAQDFNNKIDNNKKEKRDLRNQYSNNFDKQDEELHYLRYENKELNKKLKETLESFEMFKENTIQNKKRNTDLENKVIEVQNQYQEMQNQWQQKMIEYGAQQQEDLINQETVFKKSLKTNADGAHKKIYAGLMEQYKTDLSAKDKELEKKDGLIARLNTIVDAMKVDFEKREQENQKIFENTVRNLETKHNIELQKALQEKQDYSNSDTIAIKNLNDENLKLQEEKAVLDQKVTDFSNLLKNDNIQAGFLRELDKINRERDQLKKELKHIQIKLKTIADENQSLHTQNQSLEKNLSLSKDGLAEELEKSIRAEYEQRIKETNAKYDNEITELNNILETLTAKYLGLIQQQISAEGKQEEAEEQQPEEQAIPQIQTEVAIPVATTPETNGGGWGLNVWNWILGYNNAQQTNPQTAPDVENGLNINKTQEL